MAVIGGATTDEAVRRLMKATIANQLAIGLNWAGHGEKRGFKNLLLRSVISSKYHGHLFTVPKNMDNGCLVLSL